MRNTTRVPLWFIPLFTATFGAGYAFSYLATWMIRCYMDNSNRNIEASDHRGEQECVDELELSIGSDVLELSDLPEAILLYIISFMGIKDLGTLAVVNKQWKRMAEDTYLWKDLFERDFFVLDYSVHYDWKEYYKQWLISFDWADILLHCCKTGVTGRYFQIGYDRCNWDQYEACDIFSPMYCAIQYQKVGVVQRLIDSGISFENYLYQACKSRFIGTVEVLLQNGVDPNYLRDPYESPMHAATLNRCEDIISLLLEYGIDIDITTDSISITPLHLAVSHGDINMTTFLLERGSDPLKVVPELTSEFPLANIQENEEIQSLLIEYGANLNSDLHYWFGLPPL